MFKEAITERSGKILGWVETDTVGNQTLTDFYGKIVGKYDVKFNETRDFYGRRVSRGNQLMMLLR